MDDLKAIDVILAKRPKDAKHPLDQEKLLGHSLGVLESYEALFGKCGQPTRLLREWLRFFKLDFQRSFNVFHNTCLMACLLHDMGKANSGFQEALKTGQYVQAIRHEHLSGLILWLPELKTWIRNCQSLDFEILVSTVVCHHLKAGANSLGEVLNPDRSIFQLFPNEINRILEAASKSLSIENPPSVDYAKLWSFGDRKGAVNIYELSESLNAFLKKFSRLLRNNEDRRRLLSAVRAALILADSAGSGLARENESIHDWISAAFDENAIIRGDYIQENVISPRIEQIGVGRERFQWNDFQTGTDDLGERALLLAPCGSGKTLAAWRWIKSRTASKPKARVIFLYPTRATATEGFKDYVSWAPETDAALVHGTSAYELLDMFENVTDDRREKDFTNQDRLFTLGYWPRRIFSATVDQFLGFMQHSYGSTCLLPLLADSVLVIDEVHSFDKSLFSVLKAFLKNFDVPALCMTASLTENRIEDLKNLGLEVFPKVTSDYPALKDSAEMPRYFIKEIPDETAAQEMALKSLNQGKRVLWVVNTVARCQRLARSLNTICYHSRFRLMDRKGRHKEVVSAFQGQSGPVIAITTQVCEMSLDLDADVMISEAAPITALIQRMGRCNRKARPGEGKIGQVFIYTPADEKPYSTSDLSGVADFIKALAGRETSQAFLQELLEKLGPSEVEIDRYSGFIESGAYAKSREEPLREGNDFTVPAVLDSDVKEYLRLQKIRRPTDGLILQAPKKLAARNPKLAAWLYCASSANYHSSFGLFNDPLEAKP